MDDDHVALTRRLFVGSLVVVGCGPAKWETKRIDATKGIAEINIKDYPELATAGGMVAVKPTGAKRPVLIMRIENDQFRVLSLRCPHLGCVVRWDNESQVLRCPCHGSRFDDTGRVVKGPAKEALTPLPAQFAGTLVQFKVEGA